MADEATERITILLQARDRDFARAMDRNNKLIARLSRDADRNTAAMSRRVNDSMASMGASVVGLGKSFAIGLAGGVVGAAFAGITSNIRVLIGDIADLQDAADRIGVGVEDLQGLQAGFKLAGVEVSESSKALEIFSQRLGEAATGDGELLRALNQNGIALRDQNGEMRPTLDLLRDFAGAMANAGSGQERLALATDAFGRGGRALVLGLEGGRASVDGLIASAREAGLVMDESLVQRAAELDDKFDVLTMRMGVFFKGLVVGAAEAVTVTAEVRDALQDLLDLVPEEGDPNAVPMLFTPEQLSVIEAAGAASEEAAAGMRQMTADVSTLRDIAGSLVADLLETSATLRLIGEDAQAAQVSGLADRIQGLIARLDDGQLSAADFVVELDAVSSEAATLGDVLGGIDGIGFGAVIGRIGALGEAVGGLIGVARAAAAAIARINAPEVDPASLPVATDSDGSSINPPFTPDPAAPGTRPRPAPNDIDFDLPPVLTGGGGGSSGGGGSTDGFAERMAALREETAALEAEAMALLEVANAGGQYSDALDFARKRAELLHQAQQDGMEITPELVAEIDALAAAYVAAGQSAEDAARQLEEVQARGERGAKALSDVFLAALDGADSARQAVASLLIEMSKIAVQNAFLRAASGATGAAGGLFGLIGKWLAPARAGGGGAMAGQPYLVNENTPNSELFVPSRSGAVLNVAQAKSALRGAVAQPVPVAAPVTVNIQTRDAESFRQSRTQVAADIARAVRAGQRGM